MFAIIGFIITLCFEKRRKDSVEEFCRNIINEENEQLSRMASAFGFSFTLLDVEQLFSSPYHLENSLKGICTELFKQRPAKGGYILALLGYTMQLYKYCKKQCLINNDELQYTIDLLARVLADIFKENGFDSATDLEQIVSSYCRYVLL